MNHKTHLMTATGTVDLQGALMEIGLLMAEEGAEEGDCIACSLR